jgi:hypothetical protein
LRPSLKAFAISEAFHLAYLIFSWFYTDEERKVNALHVTMLA